MRTYVYKCYFSWDNGFYIEPKIEIVLAPHPMCNKEILKLLYKKYDEDGVIRNLMVTHLTTPFEPKIV